MRFQIISSGSKGNCTYIETEGTKILLDAGISMREISKRSEISLMDINAILITHEHSDHTSNLLTIAKKINATIYVEKETFEVIKRKNKNSFAGLKVCYIEGNKKYKINDLTFYTMLLSHDCSCCLGYIFINNNESLAYVTDTGFVSIPYINLLKKVDSLIIEANHDVEMLMESDREWYLKERILSIKGHMSNIICAEIVNKVLQTKKVNKIILAHISEECNDEKLAIDTVMNGIEGNYIPRIYVAYQRKALPILEVMGDKNED